MKEKDPPQEEFKPPEVVHFLIVCHQRSGSHLLASFLNSHPELAVEGELGLAPTDKLFHGVSGTWKGAIVMYRRWGRLRSLVGVERIIHLRRKTYPTAESLVRNSSLRKLRKGDHRAHRFAGDPPIYSDFEIDSNMVKRRQADVRKLHLRFEKKLAALSISLLEITYEELTLGGRNITVMPEGLRRRVLAFLKVQDRPLVTNLRRGR